MSSHPTLLIRKATKIDQDAIFKLIKHVLDGYDLKTNPEVTDLDIFDIQRNYFDNGGWFAVMVVEGEVIGCYGLFKVNKHICELRKMYLLPRYQGQGLGKMLMEEAERKARDLGFEEMVLETNTRLDKALGLYKKFGFQEYASAHLSDRCDLAMRKKLTTNSY